MNQTTDPDDNSNRCPTGNDCNADPFTQNSSSQHDQGISCLEEEDKEEGNDQNSSNMLVHHEGLATASSRYSSSYGRGSGRSTPSQEVASSSSGGGLYTSTGHMVSIYRMEPDFNFLSHHCEEEDEDEDGSSAGSLQHCLALVTEAIRVVEGNFNSLYEVHNSTYDFDIVFGRISRHFESNLPQQHQQQPQIKRCE